MKYAGDALHPISHLWLVFWFFLPVKLSFVRRQRQRQRQRRCFMSTSRINWHFACRRYVSDVVSEFSSGNVVVVVGWRRRKPFLISNASRDALNTAVFTIPSRTGVAVWYHFCDKWVSFKDELLCFRQLNRCLMKRKMFNRILNNDRHVLQCFRFGWGGWPYPGSIPGAGHLSRYVASHSGQFSLAIHSWVGAMSTSQRAVMPCSWGVKAGMVRV